MRTQRTIFARTRHGRHGGPLTAYLSLLLLGLGIPTPATALQFDSYSLSAFVESRSTTFTATAQDFSLSIGFHDFSSSPAPQTVRLGCFGSDGFGGSISIPCSPGASVSAFAHALLADVDVNTGSSMVLGGQFIPGCDNDHHPLNADLGFTLCVAARVTGLSWGGSSPLPPFAGAPPGHPVPFGVPADILNVTTVPGAFAVSGVGATIWQSGPGTAPRPIDSIGFGGDDFHFDPLTGPAQFDLVWQPDTGTWLPLFAEGRIDVLAPTPTPEPATLLLFATSGAGLGLTRWRRSREREHAM